ncbi:Baseplate J family protein [Methanolacinia petrolearia DSM 11571]|uniref:Baseplate J family protein n=1 Tax=Methanolacinia petrolearia (strain DSM 11571 / OCM 486 / SEBR 4847) TaxID=679926 RepID=E1RFI2_METP4|nr:baseplate J/gp47 family protein [Methanolacinia petrolearia]ADN36212.1 Baseplate J family protein [Methanolacinia petrolearia DSM 11571]
MTDYGVISTGFRTKTYDEVLETMIENAGQIFGYDMDLSNNTILGQKLRSIAVEIATLWQEMEGAYYSAFISQAEGQSLDRIVALVGIKRNTALKASGVVTFSVNEAIETDIKIPSGTIVGTADESILFETPEDVILYAGEMSVDVPVVAQEAGSDGNVSGGTITKLVTSMSEIDSITNSSAITGGGDAETDAKLRIRAMTMKPAAKGTVAALESALLALDGVMDVNVVEDTDSHSVDIAIAGGDSDEISSVIEETRPCGIPVTWDYATGVSIDVTVTVVKISSATEAAVQAQVTNAVSNWLYEKEIGEDLSYYKLLLAISGCSYVSNISSLSITDGTNIADTVGEVLPVEEDKRVGEGAITVNVV